MNNFVHLHLHSQMSLLDGAIRIPQLAVHLQKLGMTSVALTDHGFCGGLLEFQKAMKKAEFHSILGIETYCTTDPDNSETKQRDNNHLIILAKNNTGLKKIFKLVSEAAEKNFYYKPRINLNKLEQLAPDVVITTACLAGILRPHIEEQRDEYGVYHLAPRNTMNYTVKWLQNLFREDFYMEIQGWDDETHLQSEYNRIMIEIATENSIPVVITADCHYLTPEDYKLHETMMALQLNQTIEQYEAGDVMKYGNFFYVASSEEMYQRATDLRIPEAATNTVEVAKKCRAEIETGIYHMPTYDQKKSDDYQKFLEWKSTQI